MTETPLDPRRTMLLVMDYQPGIIARLPDPDAQVARARVALDHAREAGAHVGYVRVALAEEDDAGVPDHSRFAGMVGLAAMRPDAPETQVHADLAPAAGDAVVRKRRVGAFSTTDLAEQLAARGVDTLVLAGLSTSGVVLSTVREAADRDYRLIVLSDASADPDPEVHDFLTTRIFPGMAEVVTTPELGRRLRRVD